MHPDTPPAITQGEAFYPGYLVRAAGRLPERVFYADGIALGDMPQEGNISVAVLSLLAFGVLVGGYLDNDTRTITMAFTGLTGKNDGAYGDWDVELILGGTAAIPHTSDPWEGMESDLLRAHISTRINDYPHLVIVGAHSQFQDVRKTIDGDDAGHLGAAGMMGSVLLSEHHVSTQGCVPAVGFSTSTTLWCALSGGGCIVPLTARFTRTG
jgi:hypothetical protein